MTSARRAGRAAAAGRDGVAIIGLGLIGGSLARDLAAAGVAVTGVDPDPRALERAAAEDVIRRAAAPGRALPEDVGVVVLATPVPAILGLLEGANGDASSAADGPGGGAAGPRPVLTDVGSTKRSILAAAARAGLGARFVGGHPLAGDHRGGWGASRTGLFREARVWLCPGDADPAAVDRVAELWRSVGALPALIDPADHDRLVARVSHTPQVVASAVAGALAAAGVDAAALGPGGRDVTRLAASDPDLWTGILLDNADEVLAAVDALGERLAGLRLALAGGDAAAVRHWLAVAADWGGAGRGAGD